jgi:flagellar biosynthesis protein FlhG
VVDGRAREVRVRTGYGPRLVPGGSGVQEMANLDRIALERFAAALGAWGSDSDLLILDLGSGLTAQGVATLAASEHVVLVTQPEIAALTDAYAVVKCLVRRGAPNLPTFSIVVNRVAAAGQGEPTFRKLSEVARRFVGASLHYLGEISEEPAVAQRRLGQPPLVVSHPECTTSRAVRRILDRLEDLAGLRARRPRGRPGDLATRLLRGLRTSR